MNNNGGRNGEELFSDKALKASSELLAGDGPVSRGQSLLMQKISRNLLGDAFLINLESHNTFIKKLWKTRVNGGEGWQHLARDLQKEMENLTGLEEQLEEALVLFRRQQVLERGKSSFFVTLLSSELESLLVCIQKLQDYLVRLGQNHEFIDFGGLHISEVILSMLKSRNNLLCLKELLEGNFSLDSVEVMDLILDRMMVAPYDRDDLLEMKEFFSTKLAVQEQVREAKLRCMEEFLQKEENRSRKIAAERIAREPYRLTIGETRDNVVFLDIGIHATSLPEGLAMLAEAVHNGPAYPLYVLGRAKKVHDLLATDQCAPAEIEELERLIRMYKLISHYGSIDDYQQKGENFSLWKIVEKQVKYYREEQSKLRESKRPPFLTVVK